MANSFKKKPKALSSGCGCLIAIVFGIVCIGVVFKPKDASRHDSKPTPIASNKEKTNISTAAPDNVKKWYEGGTLHKKTAIEWQNASRADKLATCADIVTTMWQNGRLKPAIADRLSTVEDVRPYAQELVVCLDTAF